MTLNELITRILTKYPILSIYAGPNEVARRINCAEMSEDSLRELITEKMEANPDSDIKADLFAPNGNTARLKESWNIARPKKEETAAPTEQFTLPTLGNPNAGPMDALYQMQIQILRDKVLELTTELKEVKAENKTYEKDNREMRVQLDTFEQGKNMEMTLQGIENDNSFGSILREVIQSGVIQELLSKGGDGGGKNLSEDVALVVETMSPLDSEHKRCLLGILRAYAQHPQEAKELFERIYQTASGQQTAQEESKPVGGVI